MTIRRRVNDFAGRGTVTLQFGTTCCCCCLHWVGAAVGGTAGILGACGADNQEPDSAARPVAAPYWRRAAWIGSSGAIAFLAVVWFIRLCDLELPWLMWTAAVLFTLTIGGAAGIISVWEIGERRPAVPVHPVARRYVLRATWLGVFCTAALITLAAVVADNTFPRKSFLTEVVGLILGTLGYVPSLALVPVGAAAMVGAAVAKRIEGPRTSDPNERQRIAAGMGLAWRIAWVSFLLSGFFSGFGYLAMYVIVLFMD